jgi:hypothetical protein
MKYTKLFIAIGVSLTTLVACNKKFDDLLVNPNNPDASTADVDLYLNSAQLSFASFYGTASNFGASLTRMQQWYGPLYSNGYAPGDFDGLWTSGYTGVIKNVNALVPLAQQQKKYVQSGIARFMKAYVLATMVDAFGDIPNVEANQGASIINPKVDGGASVYSAALTLLDSALADFTKSGAGANPTNDLFYSGSKTSWIAAVNTMKLKLYMTTRLVDNSVGAKITTLLTANNLINASSQDLTFKYGSNQLSPDSRHPRYSANYTATGNANDFLGDYFMWAVAAEKTAGAVSTIDPRRRYYFYRQRTNYADVTQQSCPCAFQSTPGWYPSVPDKTPFCLIGSGYWGRDHGDNSGTPPDGNLRTTWGIYPVGGKFDASDNVSVTLNTGGLGAGIHPIWMSSFTSFLEAEAALPAPAGLGITTMGSARALLEKGIRASMATVLGFPATVGVTVPATFIPPATGTGSVDNYVNTVLAAYDAATTDDARQNIIMKEYYLALWGNGVEAYNNYRRTGKPNNLQLAVTTANPGIFVRSYFYPSVYVNRNQNAPSQKNPGVAANKVFWDNNPDNFIK